MPSTWKQSQQATVNSGTITTTTELATAVLPGIATGPGGSAVQLLAVIAFTTGTGVTSVTVRVRQGSGITGTVVGSSGAVVIAASTAGVVPIEVIDNPAEVNGLQYALTIQQAAATGNGSVTLATLIANYN
jgi:hypothetical protein